MIVPETKHLPGQEDFDKDLNKFGIIIAGEEKRAFKWVEPGKSNPCERAPQIVDAEDSASLDSKAFRKGRGDDMDDITYLLELPNLPSSPLVPDDPLLEARWVARPHFTLPYAVRVTFKRQLALLTWLSPLIKNHLPDFLVARIAFQLEMNGREKTLMC